jgi:hypothetical protein
MERIDDLEGAYWSDEFDYQHLREKYERAINDLGWYFDLCQKSSDVYKCQWNGKSDSLKKEGEDAFPYENASDIEVWLARQKIEEAVSFELNALKKSQIRAFPTEASDIERAQAVATMLKYLRDRGIRDFSRCMEQASRWGKTKGLMVTYCGWHNSSTTYDVTVDLEEIASIAPEFAEVFADEDRDEEAIEILNSFEGWNLDKAEGRSALKKLRKTGAAEFPIAIEDVSEPYVKTLAPDSDFIMPSYTMDVEDAPEVHHRMLMTPEEIMERVFNDGWDKGWAEHIIENHTGLTRSEFNAPHGYRGYSTHGGSRRFGSTMGSAHDIIEVIWTYEKKLNKKHGSTGIYLTIWSPDSDEPPGIQPYAKRMLLSGMKSYPFVVTSQNNEEKTLYDTTPWPILLRSGQKTMKFIRDSLIDEVSYQISPTLLVPPGTQNWDKIGPNQRIQVRPNQSPEYLQKPSNQRDGTNLEQYVKQECDELVGFGSLNGVESEIMPQRIEFETSKLLTHAQKVLKKVYDSYKVNGPEEMFIRVTGKPEPISFVRKSDEGDMDVIVAFNSNYSDPEKVEKMIQSIYQLQANSRSGRINPEAIEDFALASIDPMMADLVLMPTEQGQARLKKETTDDIAKMAAGIPVPSPTDSPQTRLQILQEYKASPTGQERLAQSEGFQLLLQDYEKKLVFQYQQQVENPQLGLLGGDPAQMGNMSMEGMNNA